MEQLPSGPTRANEVCKTVVDKSSSTSNDDSISNIIVFARRRRRYVVMYRALLTEAKFVLAKRIPG